MASFSADRSAANRNLPCVSRLVQTGARCDARCWRKARFSVRLAPRRCALPIAGAAIVLVTAAILASLLPAARASRVDVMQTLRSE
jgi:hypothetical protein